MNHDMPIRTPSLVLCFIACATIYGCGTTGQREHSTSEAGRAAETDTPVTKEPISYQKTEVNPALGADAQTHWFFHCIPKFQHETVEEVVKPGRTQLGIRVTKAEMTIGLSIKQIMGREDLPKLRDHERGHVQICEHLYANAESPARDALKGVIGQIFSGVGKDRPEALERALVSASEAVCHKYSEATAQRAEKMSAEYDRLTDHGTNQTSPSQALDSVLRAKE
jgi:hypothetical protein